MALLSVLAACRVTRLLQPTGHASNTNTNDNNNGGIPTLSKKDASPVTIGDFASQALALQLLFNRFPNDMYIAEEGSDALRLDEELLERVWKAVNAAWSSLDSDNNVWYERGELLRAIDYGQGKGMPVVTATAATRRSRVWCLDPIDGTKGFLRGRVEGGQYCIALALLEDGEPVLSILGCPNLPLPLNQSSKSVPYGQWSDDEMESDNQSMFSESRGSLFVAIRGCGCYEVPIYALEKALHTNDDEAAAIWNQLDVTRNDGSIKTPSQSTFCLGVERGFSDAKGTVLKMAQHIHGDDAITTDAEGVPDINNSMRLDGQGKYGLLARGDAEYFVRLPKDGYVDWIWDVAAGYLILKEAGGKMTDVHGNCINFSQIGVERRAKLPDDVSGLLGSCGGVFHDALVEAYALSEGDQ